ncbi:MAG: S-adenosylmethionine decarboxylase [Candidatus Pacearchaeota archaeon]|nr:MAG: S-adenosylmethionine decarboxylase [Candidatus Pacearchaeota archaeon]
MNEKRPSINHLIVEFWCSKPRCKRKKLVDLLINVIKEIDSELKAGPFIKGFRTDYGMAYTGIAVIGYSHVAVHTFPNNNPKGTDDKCYCQWEFLTCGEEADPSKAPGYLLKELNPKIINCENISNILYSIKNSKK